MTDTEMPDPLQMANLGIQHAIPVVHRMGVRFVEVRPGFAAAEVPFEDNGNHFGVMYAGVLFTVAEVLGGAIGITTFDSAKYFPLVKDLRINFRRPARSTVRASTSLAPEAVSAITAAADAHGKADFTLVAEIVDAEGTVVATTEGLYQLRTHGS
ncbi:acyl-coenzyme A thioesterase PaaI-like protein [Herbihabitans rhizosphaerae]|uniref:Acyl-coenzyme A thioesterase PaaI-like protein n=1 Tax=Herbihabitans rhizosphaerae TaxID=1872711 RepID=A0A4Q7L2Z1_9PSEU|nr:PaaI family thioesterase [Herbihabitans rhizosphaerae]RZS43496.1 acyl-coenzyme A thioesterase PaaI-like protein [Herbihabitans rhizosphaerae]